MKPLILFLLLFFAPDVLFAQSELLQTQKALIGSLLDELVITNYLQNEPEEKNFNEKLKVLEFWATWCKPCLKAVPHVNSLQRKFKDHNVIFLSVTHQSSEEVKKTLEKVKFETVVVSDQSRVLHRKLKVEHNGYMAIPRTVIVDNKNTVLWYGSPQELTEELLLKLIKNQLP